NTTTLKVVVKILQDAEIPFLMAAPTGMAAKKLSSVTGSPASTIHRAFGAKLGDSDDPRSTETSLSSHPEISDGEGHPVARKYGHNPEARENWAHSPANPHNAQVAIIDESSMLDQHLIYRLISGTSSKCRLVFVGDGAQIPSVGPGNVLKDLLQSGIFPTVSLDEIYRQHEASHIILAAHAINRGVLPDFPQGSPDFIFKNISSEKEILEEISGCVSVLYGEQSNFQILSPRHGGPLGVNSINS
ncbi:MAG: AAA family ATPase, partial [Deltaproteobacteria bacterium]|nr:AAA family ATPase [Deltaproteobacteria bacterium]